MFDNIKGRIKASFLEGLLKIANPGRDFGVDYAAGHLFMFSRDRVGCRDFLLKGTYSYDQVMELNDISGYCAGFGYCKEIGPVAFIGVPNADCVQNSGYFLPEVHAYGQDFNDIEYYFEQYSDEEARKVDDYTVYGLMMSDELFDYIKENEIPIEKINLFYDYRYKSKEEKLLTDVLAMDIKLDGTYSFPDARYLAYGSTEKFTGACGEDVPIQFAIVGENQPVGIMGLWHHHDGIMFRDVWGANEEEPELQPIRFLDDEEASQISNFKLYFYVPTHSFGKKQFVVEKVDRTLSDGFDFTMEDGTDYRLQEVPSEPAKKLTLKN